MNFNPSAYAPGEIHDPWNTSNPQGLRLDSPVHTYWTNHLPDALFIKSYWKVNQISISLYPFGYFCCCVDINMFLEDFSSLFL